MDDPIFAFYADYHNIIHFFVFLVGTFLGAWILTFLFKKVFSKWVKKTPNKLDDRLLVVFEPVVFGGLVLWGLYMAFAQLPVMQDYLNILDSVVQILFIVLILIVSIRFISVLFNWMMRNSRLKKKQKGLILTLEKILNVAIYFLGFLFVLDTVGISISPLVASLGVGGLAVSLALQPTLSNYFAGLYMAADTFLQVKDYIMLDGEVEGEIIDIRSRNTLIRTWNNNLVMVPNAKIMDSVITNCSEPEGNYSFSVKCKVAFHEDLEKVEKIANQVAKKVQKTYPQTSGPYYDAGIAFKRFGESNMHFSAFMEAKSYMDHFMMSHMYIKQLKAAFDKEKIEISLPTRKVEMVKRG